MLEPVGTYKLLVACIYPYDMQPLYLDYHIEVNKMRYENLPPVGTVLEYMSDLSGEMWRISKGKFCFGEIAVSNWRPIEYDPNPSNWWSVLHNAIGPANPKPYDLVFVLRPVQTGVVHDGWREGTSAWGKDGYNVATISSSFFARPEQGKFSLYIPIWHLGQLFSTSLPQHDAVCYFGSAAWSATGVCPDCAAKLGWV